MRHLLRSSIALSSPFPNRSSALWFDSSTAETLSGSGQSGFEWSSWHLGEVRDVMEGVCCGSDGFGA